MIELFIFIAYVLGTAFGFYIGLDRGRLHGIELCIDNLIRDGYLKYRGVKSNPEILKHDEEY